MIGLFGFSYTHEFFAWRSDGSADLEMNWRSRVIVYNVHCCTNTPEPLHQGTQKFITGAAIQALLGLFITTIHKTRKVQRISFCPTN